MKKDVVFEFKQDSSRRLGYLVSKIQELDSLPLKIAKSLVDFGLSEEELSGLLRGIPDGQRLKMQNLLRDIIRGS